MDFDLQLRHVRKVYENGTPAVVDFNLDVKKGEFIAFLTRYFETALTALADGALLYVWMDWRLSMR